MNPEININETEVQVQLNTYVSNETPSSSHLNPIASTSAAANSGSTSTSTSPSLSPRINTIRKPSRDESTSSGQSIRRGTFGKSSWFSWGLGQDESKDSVDAKGKKPLIESEEMINQKILVQGFLFSIFLFSIFLFFFIYFYLFLFIYFIYFIYLI